MRFVFIEQTITPMETKFDPKDRPEGGVALFREMLEKNKWEEENPSPEDIAMRNQALIELRKRNAAPGTAIVNAMK